MVMTKTLTRAPRKNESPQTALMTDQCAAENAEFIRSFMKKRHANVMF